MATKEVRFDQYCLICKHLSKDASEDPCWDCLNQGWNFDSHKPTMFEEDEEKTKNPSKESAS